MDALQALSASIEQRTHNEIADALAAQEAQHQVARQAAQEAANLLRQQQEHAIDAAVAQERRKVAQQAANQGRNRLLAHKQQLLQQLYEQAFTKMSDWHVEQVAYFVQGVCRQMELTDATLVLGERTDYAREAVRALLPETITLSDDVLPEQAGFVLRVAGIEYNYGFDALLQQLKKDFTTELAHRAFDA